MSSGLELLTTAEMAEADRRAVAAGVPSLMLMENAGRAVADEAVGMLGAGGRIVVVCGPGNNGGDGYVAGRLLRERGYSVSIASVVAPGSLKGDAQVMAERWLGHPGSRIYHETWPQLVGGDCELVIDAMLGAGLSRAPDGAIAQAIGLINSRRDAGEQTLAVDVPSGLDGSTGNAPGPVVQADRTVTFVRMKPGHLLMPGRALCGDVVLADIGMPDEVLEGSGGAPALGARSLRNNPELWCPSLPRSSREGHKYTRGHAIVVSGGPEQTGAARLGARGALRVGAGLVTLVGSRAAIMVHAAHVTAIMVKSVAGPEALAAFLQDQRRNAVLIGPGAGVGAETAELVLATLRSQAAVVLDADAVTSFASAAEAGRGGSLGFLGVREDSGAQPVDLFAAIAAREPQTESDRRDSGPATSGHAGGRRVVLTPHEGEFRRLYPDIAGSKLERARAAAARSGAVVVLKGPDTVIAHPDGRAAINDNAPPWLATAGSGDVLAGFIAGLLAQQMPEFEAACAAVWMHGAVAARFGPGLIAEDLPEGLPAVLGDLFRQAAASGGGADR